MIGVIRCFLSKHRWNTDGICGRCHGRCQHSVLVYDPGRRTAKCLDCGVPRDKWGSEAAGAGIQTLLARVQRSAVRAGGWDEGPFA